ncbi:MAG: hypothetical protein AVDCRST_MAG77-1687 [uncultured Chloroflexi bacterium]|uniref:Uncharacterized protein n=1 Tax=uncultured Chloroflexota bacterium TaxID=166587 RepID=A0A6J4I8V1_9CHLR|nr:MAG: hypothetical protein AVDCRST_MAG77-1687 [uncultured Chloroflexota bacterium]
MRLSRLSDATAWAAELAAVARGAEVQPLESAVGAPGSVVYLGSVAARERIWLQFDAASDPTAVVAAAWAVVESVTSERVSRHRLPVVGRACLAVALPAQGRLARPEPVPYLDGGLLGAQGSVLAAMRRFQPTWLVHFQDWSGTGTPSVQAVSLAGSSRTEVPAAGELGESMRVVESYLLDGDLHRRLDGGGRLRTWLGQPTAAARALGEAPDPRACAMTARYVERMGYRTPRSLSGAERARVLEESAVIEVGPGRYIPRPAWRRLGGGNLAELALTELGAGGLTGQTLGGSVSRRAGQALALAEGAVVHRLNLDVTEGGP